MSPNELRIAFTGNIGNTHFSVAKALRSAGIEAEMFVRPSDPLAWKPETESPEYANAYPDWIHSAEWYGVKDAATPWRAPLVDRLREYDMIVASGSTPTFVQFAERPWAFFALGGGLTVRPFPWVTFQLHRSNLLSRLGQPVVSLWQRRALRRADQVWIQPFDPFVEAVTRLEIAETAVSETYFPLIVDTEVFRPQPDVRDQQVPWVDQMCQDSDFVIFSPTRSVFGTSEFFKRTGQWKGTQELLDGFAEFVRRDVVDRPVLALPDWRWSSDLEITKRRVKEMGIAPYVRFITPPRDQGFNRTEIAQLHAAADATVDQFSSGWFGLVSLEGMACGNPVISRIDRPVVDQMYDGDWCWLAADTSTDAADHFERLATDPSLGAKIGEEACEWIERHHSAEATRDRYVNAVLREAASIVT